MVLYTVPDFDRFRCSSGMKNTDSIDTIHKRGEF